MPRKVFISFLGTNNYVQCRYDINGVLSAPVRFVQEALIEHLCQDWTEDDRIYIFCTSKETTGEQGSKEINWLDNGQTRISDDMEKIGLQHRLQDLQMRIGLKAQIEEHDIEAGFSEEEIWEIFDMVYARLQPEDQIYFDVTHAFRSIPLFSIVLFNYSKFMKDTRLMTIKYGAFEKLGPAYKVKDIPLEQRVAPVIDLTNIARLQEYNQMASSLKDFGKVKSLKSVLAYIGDNPADSVLRDLSSSISEMDEYIATIDLKKIKSGNFIKKFRDSYKFVTRKRTILAPIMNILHELYQETDDFEPKDSFRNIEAAINWTIKHDMLMQAYPLTEEYIIMRVTDKYADERPLDLPHKKYRQFISSLLGIPQKDFQIRLWKDILAQYPDVTDFLADEPFVIRLRPLYDKIRNMRNSLAHGNGSVKYSDLQKGIADIIQCISFVNPEYRNYRSTHTIFQF